LSPLHDGNLGPETEVLWRRQASLVLLLSFLLGLHALGIHLDTVPFPNIKRQQTAMHQDALAIKPGRSPGKDQLFFHVKKEPPAVLLNINRASQEELRSLPGIGPVLAGRIIAYREEKGPFTEVAEIKEVSGIGEKRFESIKDWIRVR
jgi:competence ComEA-like helix-hairpin-helix protein